MIKTMSKLNDFMKKQHIVQRLIRSAFVFGMGICALYAATDTGVEARAFHVGVLERSSAQAEEITVESLVAEDIDASERTSTDTDYPSLPQGGALTVVMMPEAETAVDVVAQDETQQDETKPDEGEYDNLAVAHVHDYVNVRSAAGTDTEVIGKMYDGSVAEILEEVEGEDGLWFHVVSGSVNGFIKAEYFVYGQELIDTIDQYIQKFAVVQVTRLNVRKEPSVDSERVSYVESGTRMKVADFLDDWISVYYNGDKTGYVASEYVTVQEEYTTAKSLEEERAELAKRQEQEEREKQEKLLKEQALLAQQTPADTEGEALPGDQYRDTVEDTTYTAPSAGSYSTNSELRSNIVSYAMQYVGKRYVHGGQSLSDGTDCSGFTCYVYRDFGYSISRTPSGQYSSAGRSISLEEAQPGDIICYGSNSCSHVGLYIGDGQIVHEANSKKGCIVSDVNYMNILGVRNVID